MLCSARKGHIRANGIATAAMLSRQSLLPHRLAVNAGRKAEDRLAFKELNVNGTLALNTRLPCLRRRIVLAQVGKDDIAGRSQSLAMLALYNRAAQHTRNSRLSEVNYHRRYSTRPNFKTHRVNLGEAVLVY